ncbi:MAG: cobalamin-dependent protein [Candidatus Lokiarchaeota archaeon]|nr:cobalamin-dependent protein [Candidatus Lokiarchaeota archaeon]
MSYQALMDALVKGEVATVVSIVDKAINVENKKPKDIIDNGLAPGMDLLGDQYDKGDAFLVDLVVAAEAFKRAMDIMKPKLQTGEPQIGTVIIGTILGDIHDLGKNLAKTILEAAGFKVIDLGVDVTPQTFASAVRAEILRAENVIVGISSLISTTMLSVKDVVAELENQGIRDEVKIIVGGAPVNEEFVKEIGADMYAGTAFEGVDKVKKAMGV